MTKLSASTFLAQIPGTIATSDELRRLFVSIAGYLFVGILPERVASGVFERLANNRRTKRHTRLEQDPVIERMKRLLDGYCSDSEIRSYGDRYYERRLEDMWGRWHASHKSTWPVRTQVDGLEHVDSALQLGNGVVFWGMSFCGTLFPKIALSRAGVALTQLSSADHGASYPLTLLGKWAVGPLYCLPEGRYLYERIRIPAENDNSYLKGVGAVLQKNGCVWISGERLRAKKLLSAKLLGRIGRFPVGAPLLALRYGSALLPTHTQRKGRFFYQVTIDPPIPLTPYTSHKHVINQAVQEYAQRLGARIIENPGDWDWEYSWSENLLSNQPQR